MQVQIQRDSRNKPFIKVDIHIPGRATHVPGGLDAFHAPSTHVQVLTSRHSSGPGIVSYALEVGKFADGGECFSSGGWSRTLTYNHLAVRVTEKALMETHEQAMRALKAARPDLFTERAQQ